MWSSIPSADRLVAGLLACALAAGACGGEEEAPDASAPVASAEAPAARAFVTLRELEGKVECRVAQTWEAASEGRGLDERGAVRTGKDGRVELVFAQGGSLSLEPDTEIELADAEDGFAMTLGKGEIRVSSELEGMHFRLGMGEASDRVTMSNGTMRLTRSGPEDMALEMVVGSGMVRREGGETELFTGSELSMRLGEASTVRRGGDEEGGETWQVRLGESTVAREDEPGEEGEEAAPEPEGEASEDAPEMIAGEGMRANLISRGGRARFKPPDARRFARVPKKGAQLAPGTAIKVGRKGSATVDAEGARFELSARTNALWHGWVAGSGGPAGRLELKEGGRARVRLSGGGAGASGQRIETGGASVRVRRGGKGGADASVRREKGKTRVVVRYGEARVAVGGREVRVGAGQSLSFGADGDAGAPQDLAPSPVEAREGARTRVFYDRGTTPVTFKWGGGGGGGTIEIAASGGFEPLLASEKRERPTFTLPGLGAGRYFWRVRGKGGAPGPVGQLEIKRDPTLTSGGRRRVTNVIQDTGRETRIYFQGSHPALTFAWHAVDGAARYRVRIYHEDELDRPVVDRTVDKSRMGLAAGKLAEGTYFWYQAALDGEGGELATSQMNKLSITFDNAAPILRVDAPRPGGRARGGKLKVKGVASHGARLVVNGERVGLATSGRFAKTVPARWGKLAVFQVVKREGEVFYFLRHLR